MASVYYHPFVSVTQKFISAILFRWNFPHSGPVQYGFDCMKKLLPNLASFCAQPHWLCKVMIAGDSNFFHHLNEILLLVNIRAVAMHVFVRWLTALPANNSIMRLHPIIPNSMNLVSLSSCITATGFWDLDALMYFYGAFCSLSSALLVQLGSLLLHFFRGFIVSLNKPVTFIINSQSEITFTTPFERSALKCRTRFLCDRISWKYGMFVLTRIRVLLFFTTPLRCVLENSACIVLLLTAISK